MVGSLQGEGFGSGRPRQNVDLLEISQNVNNVASRLRVLEDRYANLRKKLQMSEQGGIEFERQVGSRVKVMQADVEVFRKSVEEASHRLQRMEEELAMTVKSDEFKVIEKFLDAWQPLEFVTKDELRQVLDRQK
ncbi:MAG: hypothetical protein HC945_02940 [Nitrosarchaeum sp.]|nr:hypothetical protein [Nitrosarchaeum sp.]